MNTFYGNYVLKLCIYKEIAKPLYIRFPYLKRLAIIIKNSQVSLKIHLVQNELLKSVTLISHLCLLNNISSPELDKCMTSLELLELQLLQICYCKQPTTGNFTIITMFSTENIIKKLTIDWCALKKPYATI